MSESFIQFYTPSRYNNYLDLGNGFSDCLTFCKTRGEMFWVKHEGLKWASTYKMINNKCELEKFEFVELPQKSETVYISALYTTQLYQAYVWAKRYREIRFIVGGPAIRSKLFATTESLPNNLILTTKSVEEIFGIDDFSYNWDIDIPLTNKKIVFSYTIDTSCYWSQCIYCNFAFCKRRKREKLNFEFETVFYPYEKLIRMNTSSTTPKQLKEIIPALPEMQNTRFGFYLRFGRDEVNALNEIDISKKSLKFMSGVEFPSNPMLKFMNKGVTTNEIFDMLKVFEGKENLEVVIFIILGWEELTTNDIFELKRFLELLPNNCKIALTRIFARPFTKLYDMYDKFKEQKIGPFYLGYIPKISSDKLKLNTIAKNLILKYNVIDFTKGLL